MAEPEGTVALSRRGPIAIVTIDRPTAHNAMTAAMFRRLRDCVAELNTDPDVRVVVLTGAGDRAFCTGGDLLELLPRMVAGERDLLFPDPSQRFFSDVQVPIVAAVNGMCLAGGLEMLLGTDIRVAAQSATFGLPEVRWGLIPGGGSHVRLPQQVAWPSAMYLLLTGESVGADAALRMGLITEICPDSQVLDRAIEIAGAIARCGPVAVRTAKEVAVTALDQGPGFRLEMTLNDRVLDSGDAREGLRAFLEKRPPEYENR